MTLAALRRRLVPGVKLRLVWHVTPHHWREPIRSALLSGEGYVRPIGQVRSKDVSLLDDNGRESWLTWPKAGDVQISPDGAEFTVGEGGTPYARYRIEPAGA